MLKVEGPRVLTKHREAGGARAHSACVIPCFAVVGACLVWPQPPHLQMGPVPVFSPVQQGPVVEPGWQVGNTMEALSIGRGLHLPPAPHSAQEGCRAPSSQSLRHHILMGNPVKPQTWVQGPCTGGRALTRSISWAWGCLKLCSRRLRSVQSLALGTQGASPGRASLGAKVAKGVTIHPSFSQLPFLMAGPHPSPSRNALFHLCLF